MNDIFLRLAGPCALAVALGGVPSAWGGEVQRVPGLPPERVTVEATPIRRVTLSVSVLNRRGEPVTGLSATDFIVKEAGKTQTLLDFGRESDRVDRPLSAVFLVDRSGSIGKQMAKWRMACSSLLSALRPGDEVKVAAFTTDVEVLAEFTHDPAALAEGLEHLDVPGGGTRLFPAVDRMLHEMRRRPGRKAIFLLTDGLDNDYSQAWSVSSDEYLKHIVQLAVESQVTIVTILPGPTGFPFLAAQDLAVQTGGWWLYPSDDLPGLVRRLGERLLESYVLTYDSSRPLGDARRKLVEVTLGRPELAELEVRTVGGVFGDTPLEEILLEELDSGDDEQRARAVLDLGFLPGSPAPSRMRKALKDKSPKVRGLAAEALARRGDLSAADALAKLLRDPEPGVRDAAQAALTALMDASTDPSLHARILDAIESEGRP
ncbi:MAG TPA: VWA domain-containing protein [Candidatus Polarisedimenticolia bacterium]|nr:VWA domain-containing protein [Candidatus Polarisedimenticolia bacterium]